MGKKEREFDKQVDVNNGTGPFANKCSKRPLERRLLEFRELCELAQCARYMNLRYIPYLTVFPSILPLSPFIS